MISNIGSKVIARYGGRVARVVPNGNEVLAQILAKRPDLEQCATLEYKSYPYQITHYDPEHHDYIPSARDDYEARIKLDSYNYNIERLRQDIKIQKQVDELLANLERPYLKGRPGIDRNITGGLRDYFPVDVGFTQRGDPQFDREIQQNPVFRNEKRWIAQSIFYHKSPTYSHILQYEQELANRPVTSHFNPDKGCKYDVEVPYAERYPYLADRLGHPEFHMSPIERLLRLEKDIAHPVYNDQPFVQQPSAVADPTLNFQEGEVLYENTRLLEWLRLWLSVTWAGYFWCALFAPLQLLYKTHIPSELGLEGNFYQFYQHSPYNFDSLKLHTLGISVIQLYASYAIIRLMYNGFGKYIVKAQYSQDKELLFVTRIGPYGGLEEEVFETHHLEFLPHGVRTAANFSTLQQDDGFYTLTSLGKKRTFLFYKGDQFWNPKLKKEFISNHSQLVTKQHYGLKRSQQELFQDQLCDNAYLPTAEPPRP